MTNDQILFNAVFTYVRKNGDLKSEPKSCWGEYRWTHPLGAGCEVSAHLQDEGYTKALYVGGLLKVAETCDDKLVFYKGDMNSILTTARMLGLDF